MLMKFQANLAVRPPILCASCGDQGIYSALNDVLEEVGDRCIFFNISFYNLESLPRYNRHKGRCGYGRLGYNGKQLFRRWFEIGFCQYKRFYFTHSGITGCWTV